MDEKEVQMKLVELLRVMDSRPASSKHVPLDEMSFQDILDELSLTARYLAFDCEATRRENRVLREGN